MHGINILADELAKGYEEVGALAFYRDIFPIGSLDVLDVMTKGKYTGIAIEITKEKKQNGKPLIKRYTVTDELDSISLLKESKNFCIISPISYIGKQRVSENARNLYALCIEIDYLKTREAEQIGLAELLHQCTAKVGWLPLPTYLVASGNGLHLYYVFEKPIPLFENVSKSLVEYKREITKKLWNRHTTTHYEENQIQYESLFQGFRMVGTATKNGDVTRAFRIGAKVSIEYMNEFAKAKIVPIYKSEQTLAEAKGRYPQWYQNKIIDKKPKGSWVAHRGLYDWWKERILNEAVAGHRYYCLMCLCIYAIKCDISREELENDCFELLGILNERTKEGINPFIEKDVLDALQTYEDKNLVTYPISSIVKRSGIHIEKNKRNYQKQAWHLEDMRARKITMKNRGQPFKNAEGRPSAEQQVKQWRKFNKTGKKAECIKATGLSKPTVYKWWN